MSPTLESTHERKREVNAYTSVTRCVWLAQLSVTLRNKYGNNDNNHRKNMNNFYSNCTFIIELQSALQDKQQWICEKKKKSYRSSSRMRSRDVGESVEQREEIQKLEKRWRKGGRDEEEKEKVQSRSSSKTYLWDVFLYLRLTEKTNMRTVRHRLKWYAFNLCWIHFFLLSMEIEINRIERTLGLLQEPL